MNTFTEIILSKVANDSVANIGCIKVAPDAPTSRPLYFVKDRESLSNFDEYYIIPEQNAIGYRGETVAMFTEITYRRNTERRGDMLTFTAYSIVNDPIATGEIWLNLGS